MNLQRETLRASLLNIVVLGVLVVFPQSRAWSAPLGFDDFEGAPAPSTNVKNSTPSAGSWVDNMPATLEGSFGTVYDNSAAVGPAAHGGTKKLRIGRDTGALMGFGSFTTAGPFPQAITSPGDLVRVEFYLYQSTNAGSFAQMGFMSSPNSGVPSPQLATLFEIDNAGIIPGPVIPYQVGYLTDDTGRVGTGLTATPDEWEKWVFEYEVGSTVLNLTIDGPTQGERSTTINNPARDTGLGGALPNVVGWHFSAGTNPSLYFVDDVSATLVPEPSSLALLAFGCLAILGRVRRKRT